MAKRLSIKRPALAVAEEALRPAAVLDHAVRLLAGFGFQQIAPPPVAEARLFSGSPLFRQRFGQHLLPLMAQPGGEFVLSPTHLPSVAKLFFEAATREGPHIAKWFYIAPLVKELGREMTVEHELGVLILGDESSLAMAQLINVAGQTLRNLGIAEVTTELTSRGCRFCQQEYAELLQNYLQAEPGRLCEYCQAHLAGRVINVFSCPVPTCQELLAVAPQMMDFLDEACRLALAETLEIMDELSLPYTLNPSLAGTFGAERIVFRLNTPPGTLLGQGGTFTSLLALPGKLEPLPLLGFLSSLEHLAAFIPDESRRSPEPQDVFVIPIGIQAARKALGLYRDLQNAGVRVSEAMLESAGIKWQLKAALDRKCEIALIIGQKEAMDETVILRDMRGGMQELFTAERIVEEVKKRLGK